MVLLQQPELTKFSGLEKDKVLESRDQQDLIKAGIKQEQIKFFVESRNDLNNRAQLNSPH